MTLCEVHVYVEMIVVSYCHIVYNHFGDQLYVFVIGHVVTCDHF